LTPQKRFSGSGGSDPGLSDVGRGQAERVAEALAGRGSVREIVSSPLARCRETAGIVGARLGLPVRIEDGLRETDFGAWEGLTFGEVRERYPEDLNAWLGSAEAEPTGGGESFAAVAERVAAARDKLLRPVSKVAPADRRLARAPILEPASHGSDGGTPFAAPGESPSTSGPSTGPSTRHAESTLPHARTRARAGGPPSPPPGPPSGRTAPPSTQALAAHPGRTVLVVSHVTPIKTLVRLALGAPPESLFRMELSAASLSEVAYYADGNASLRLLNDASHLR